MPLQGNDQWHDGVKWPYMNVGCWLFSYKIANSLVLLVDIFKQHNFKLEMSQIVCKSAERSDK